MNVEFSQQASLLIEEYRNALVNEYGRSEERADELKQQMEDTIRAKASNADELPVCQFITLGQQKDSDKNCLNQNLRFFKYETKSTESTWGVSVICDLEHDVATVHRILHSSRVIESSPKWILLREFVNRNTTRNKTMKKLNITKERFEKSRYFQKKYGKLEYVSESGKVYKTNKGNLIQFVEENNTRRDKLNKIVNRTRTQEYDKKRDFWLEVSKLVKSVKAFDNDLKETFEMVVQMSDNKLIDGRDFTSEYGRKSGISWCYSNATDMDDLYKFGILIDSCHGYHTYLYRNVTDGTWTKTVFGFLSPDGFPKDGSDNDLISWIVEHKRTDFYDALKAYASEAKKFIKKVEDAVDNLEDD